MPLSRRWIKNKRALVVGLGKSGLSAARLLHAFGARVALSDKRPPSFLAEELRQLPAGLPLQTESHSWLLAKNFDLAVVSPGVPWELPELRAARRKGLPLWNEMGLALDLIQPREIAAITGTNGKTTTTALLAEMMKRNGNHCVMAGNIGTPLTSVVNRVNSQTTLILEVSSYQLEGLQGFRPRVGCLLNITPDHLQRHKTMDRYADIKFSLFQHQGPDDWAVLNADDPLCRRGAGRCAGRVLWLSSHRELPGQAYANRGHLVLDGAPPPWELPLPRHLIGPHNVFNALAASSSAAALGAKSDAINQALRQFKGMDHRCQVVGRIRGVLYVNDSKSTNVDSTRVAVEAIERPLFLILGGRDKGSPYTPLIPLLRRRVKKIFLIGEAAPLIRKDLGGIVPMESVGDLENAVRRARASARPGDAVLLSPACASFDQFKNFEHRGQVFNDLVLSLR
jgi:UDP-N-acetylmuramoylalanine--D-glutamate ligase